MRKQLFVVGAAALTLASCNDHQQQAQQQAPQPVYNTVAECQQDYNNPNRDQCVAAFAASQQALPRYGARTQCEAQYGVGNCESRNGNGDSFYPIMAGFMLGSMLNNGSYGYQPAPVYVGSGGYLYSGGRSLGYQPTRVYVNGGYHYSSPPHTTVIIHHYSSSPSPSSAPVQAPAPTVQRGGFGGTQTASLSSAARPSVARPATNTIVSTSRPVSSSFGSSSYGSSTARGGFGASSFRSSSSGGFGGGSSYHSSGSSFHSSGRH